MLFGYWQFVLLSNVIYVCMYIPIDLLQLNHLHSFCPKTRLWINTAGRLRQAVNQRLTSTLSVCPLHALG